MNECRKAPHSVLIVAEIFVSSAVLSTKNAYRQKLLAAFFTNIWRNLAYCQEYLAKPNTLEAFKNNHMII